MDAVNNFLNCLNTGTFSDIVLVAGDKEISCHRFILSASSSVFEVSCKFSALYIFELFCFAGNVKQ